MQRFRIGNGCLMYIVVAQTHTQTRKTGGKHSDDDVSLSVLFPLHKNQEEKINPVQQLSRSVCVCVFQREKNE